ncbi:MAG: peptidase M20 [Woeseiaceae bacterium]|nr:peptidase M20 [Woeseiaceae bacterium]|tara:strand:- start:4747 stop:5910 length:1164 start_codon:yes stop_codon:yes gene_type:complete
MPNVEKEIADLIEPLVSFRRDIHAHPELGFEEFRTANKIAEALKDIGLEVHTGIGKTGVVGVLRNGSSDRSLAFRADMDALPIHEETGLSYASKSSGVFHGCGHDGHVAMLLGAARHLARTKRFGGTVNFVFQPAEEGLGGANEMIKEGLFDICPTDEIYALHNWPDLDAGMIQTRPGPIMAAADKFEITLNGSGGHAALPHQTPDTLLAASELVSKLNSIISRRVSAFDSAVLTVTQINGGHTHNVIPAKVIVGGTVRTFDVEIQDRIEQSLRDMVESVALAHEVKSFTHYDRYYPATINDPDAAEQAIKSAKSICKCAEMAPDPAFTSEDFSFMLQAKKGAYVWLGQKEGESSCPLHHPKYDFNDKVIPLGIQWYSKLAEDILVP